MKRFLMMASLIGSTLAGGAAFAHEAGPAAAKVMVKEVAYRGGQRASWQLLGSSRVNGRRDVDVVPVGARAGRFSKLMLVADRAGVDVVNLRVTFGNGRTETVAARMILRDGQRSGTIDLPGDARAIEKITVMSRDLRGRGRATVEIYGLRDGFARGGHGGRGGRY